MTSFSVTDHSGYAILRPMDGTTSYVWWCDLCEGPGSGDYIEPTGNEDLDIVRCVEAINVHDAEFHR